jgi:hypothetical protein
VGTDVEPRRSAPGTRLQGSKSRELGLLQFASPDKPTWCSRIFADAGGLDLLHELAGEGRDAAVKAILDADLVGMLVLLKYVDVNIVANVELRGLTGDLRTTERLVELRRKVRDMVDADIRTTAAIAHPGNVRVNTLNVQAEQQLVNIAADVGR